MFNLRFRDKNPTLFNGMADRVKGVLERNRHKIILDGATASYTGDDILRHLKKVRPVFAILSRKRGRVGILIPNSPGAAKAILMTIALGRIPVILDASTKREKIEELLPKMNLDFLIVSAAAYPELTAPCSLIRVSMSGQMVNLETRKINKGPNLPREGTGIILYTSGSSGEPKGVQLSAEGILYTVDTLIDYFSLNDESISTCVLPLCHTMGMNTQFLPTFFAGGKCVFHQSSLSLRKIYRRIIESEGTFVGLIAELLQFCYDEKIRRDLEPAKMVKHVQIAGGVIREDHLRIARELFPNAVIHKGYGLTEAIRISMIPSSDPNFFSDTAGYPMKGQDVKVFDPDMNELPAGMVGALFVKGPNVMLGYDTQVSELPRAHNGYLETGDLGAVMPDGRLVIHGRHDSIFKVKGERVSGREIETAAREVAHSFRDVKCLPVECKKRGVRPVLFVEMPHEDTFLFLSERKSRFEQDIKEKLSDAMKVPKDVYLMTHFPRTNNGKIRNRALQDFTSARDRVSDLGIDGQGFHFYMIPDSQLTADDSKSKAENAGGSAIA